MRTTLVWCAGTLMGLIVGSACAPPATGLAGTDGGATDGGATDGGATDGGAADAGTTDSGVADSGATDGGATDGTNDGGVPADGGEDGGSPVDAGADAGPGGLDAGRCTSGASGCLWASPVEVVGSTTTAALNFPTTWFGFPIDGVQIFTSLSGTVSVTNSANLYSEQLFIIEFMPVGTCPVMLTSPTPQSDPPNATAVAQFIVKAPTSGTFTLPINLTFPGGVPISSCILLGINGGSVEMAHDVTGSANLSLSFVPPQTSGQTAEWVGGEMCFGQSFGCQLATTDDSQSFAAVTPIAQTESLVALYGDISDSTFDGTSLLGAPPAGAWTAHNDFYVYHGTECSTFGVTSGPAGPGSYYASIPADATLLLSMPVSGSGLGVATTQVFQSFSNVTLNPGDCLVELWGLVGGGGFDNETQVFALVKPAQ